MKPVHHTLAAADRSAMAQIRAAIAAHRIVVDRNSFDQMIERTPAADGVRYRPGTVGGVTGGWCETALPKTESVLMYLHGGAYTLGSAYAYRNIVSQLAARAGLWAFIPDYALAPERPFPAAMEDSAKVYCDLVGEDNRRVILAGDSAGGGLALALLAAATRNLPRGSLSMPLGAAVISPWTDLALTGPSMESRASADPILNRKVLSMAAAGYLAGHDPKDPRASPLYGPLTNLPAIRIDVGEDEVLLDDSRRYAERLASAGVEVDLNIWEGMPHGFPNHLGVLAASALALDEIATFIKGLSRLERRIAE